MDREVYQVVEATSRAADSYWPQGSAVAKSCEQGRTGMVSGAHVILYSSDASADRAFLRDVLGFRSVDAGHGWLIFALPPAEVAVHPAEKTSGEEKRHELYFMCDDLESERKTLYQKCIQCSSV